MSKHRQSPSTGEVAMEVAGYSVGLGVLTMALFPFSVVGLLLFVIAPAVVLIAPLLVVGLVAAPFVLLFRGARSVARSSVRRVALSEARCPANTA